MSISTPSKQRTRSNCGGGRQAVVCCAPLLLLAASLHPDLNQPLNAHRITVGMEDRQGKGAAASGQVHEMDVQQRYILVDEARYVLGDVG